MWLGLWVALGLAPVAAARATACVATARARPIISLDLRDADLGATFRLLAEAAHVSIVVGGDVRGTVTVTIKDAPWLAVLCTIAGSKGLAAYRDGKIYTVEPR